MKNYSSLFPTNFSILSYPKLENITDYNLSMFTNTNPLIKAPQTLKTKNPILIIAISSVNIAIFWSYKNTLSINYLDKTLLSLSKDSFSLIYTIQKEVKGIILSISNIKSDSNQFILLETKKNYQIFDTDIKLLEIIKVNLKDIHCNPFYPDQISYLTEDNLCIVNNKSFSYSTSEYDGFEFYFSPFLLTLFNKNTVSLKDMRQENEAIIHSGMNIHQALPIDCCYSMAVLTDCIEIYDCRY